MEKVERLIGTLFYNRHNILYVRIWHPNFDQTFEYPASSIEGLEKQLPKDLRECNIDGMPVKLLCKVTERNVQVISG